MALQVRALRYNYRYRVSFIYQKFFYNKKYKTAFTLVIALLFQSMNVTSGTTGTFSQVRLDEEDYVRLDIKRAR